MNTTSPTQSSSLSIRQRLMRYLLIGLPVLFLCISLAVSLPLYQQILAEEDEGMQQYAHILQSEFANNIDKEQWIEESSALFGYLEEDTLLPIGAEYAMWGKNEKLVSSSLLDMHDDYHEHDDIFSTELDAHERSQLIALFKTTLAKQLSKTSNHAQKSSGFINTGSIFAKDTWRIYYAVDTRLGNSTVVAQPWRMRLITLWEYVIEQMTLLLLSLPLLIGIVIWVVHKGLRPIHQLASEVENRHASDLAPIEQAVPKELKPLTTALNQLFAKVTSSIDKEKRFIADASHELKSPITAIKLQANDLQESLMQQVASTNSVSTGYEGALSSIESLQRIQRTADRATHLVEQLLTLTKLNEQAQLDIEMQPIDWMSVSEEALQSVSLTAREQGVKLLCHTHETDEHDVLPLTGNTALLSLLLRNLLDNAIRYGAGGDNVARKVVELTLASDSINVRDFGNGIEPVYLDSIRERFFRPAGQRHTGSGLGLSIVDRIAELHGLYVDIANHENGGVNVTVTKI